MGEQYSDILKRALGEIEKGELPSEEDMDILRHGYKDALNSSPCPCGSDVKFEDCCKIDWQVLIRGVRGLQRERNEARQEQQAEPANQIQWLARLGVDREGRVRVEAMSPAMSNPFTLAGMLLDAYQNIFTQAILQMTDRAVGGLADAVGLKKTNGPKLPI